MPVEKQYTFDTEDGTKTLAELFEGRSELLAYHVMFGPEWTAACPGCTSLADHFNPTLPHLNGRDVTMICMSHAPIEYAPELNVLVFSSQLLERAPKGGDSD